MDKELDPIAVELLNKLQGQFSNIILRDENYERLSTSEEDVPLARMFTINHSIGGKPIGTITIELHYDELTVINSIDIASGHNHQFKRQYFSLMKELRQFAKSNLLNFDPDGDLTKNILDKRGTTTIGETTMRESKLFGTSKTSYQNLGDAKILVKHNAPVNFEHPAGRTQRIESIYIENSEGERFKYPFKHLNGARALAQHVSHAGNPYDAMGQHIIGLSEELSKLRMFKQYVEKNPVVSEAMGAVNSKVIERIVDVKKTLQSLQSPRHYESFVESFIEPEETIIPESTLNDWIDRLTVRTFNEELKNVFPYIFKLVSEDDIPIKELTADDLVTEMDNSVDEYTDADMSISEFSQYEGMLNKIVEGPSATLYSDDQTQQDAAIEELNLLLAEPIQVGVDGRDAIAALSSLIEDDELMEIFKELSDIGTEFDARSILRDYVKVKDAEYGADVLSKLEFPDELVSEVPPPEPEIPADPDPTADLPAPTPPAPPAVPPALPPAVPPAAPVMASINHSGNRLIEAIRRALKSGMQIEDTFTVSGKTVTLRDAIKRTGMTVESFMDPQLDTQEPDGNEIMEFIKSMFNSDDGSFPKGETGVLIACEKKFGEQSMPMAQRIVEKLSNIGETVRMKKLAGMM